MKKKTMQCYECKGYRHIQIECANIKKKKLKLLITTWSDEESEDDMSESDKEATFTTELKEETEEQSKKGSIENAYFHLLKKDGNAM